MIEVENAFRIRLRQVRVNLLSNTVVFSDQGRVALAVSPVGFNRIRFEVSDTGAGIPPGRLDVIFERFAQADGATTRPRGGTGLGLAIRKGLVDFMGGEIGVASELRAGSIFWITVAGLRAGKAARPQAAA